MTTKHHTSATARHMEGPLARIARAISRNWDVEVRFTGTKCATDGKVIYLPYNAEYLGDDKKQLIHGNLDHETAHVAEEREAAEAGRPGPIAIMRAEHNATTRMLFNAFEDVRIENKYAAQYPGVAENLAAINRQSVDMFHARHGKGGARNFWHLFGCAIIAAARGFDYSWCPAPVLAWLPLIEGEIEAAKTARDASEVMALARAVYAKVRMAAEELKENQQDQDGEDGADDSSDEENLVIHMDDDEQQQPKEDEEPKEDNDIHMDLRDEKPEAPESEDEDEDDSEGGNDASDGSGDDEDEPEGADHTEAGGEDSDGADDSEDSSEDTEGAEDGEGEDSGDTEDGDDTEDGEGSEGDDTEDGEGGEADESEGSGGSSSGDESDEDGDGDAEPAGEDEGGEGDDHDVTRDYTESPNADSDDAGSEGDAGSVDGEDGPGIAEDGIDLDEVDLDGWDPTEQEATEEDIVNEARREIEKGADEDKRDNKRYVPHPECVARDRWYKPLAVAKGDASLIEDYREGLEGVREQVGALRQRLLSTIRIMTTSRRVGDQQEGRLDSASLHTLRAGNKRIFEREVRGMEVNTAVTVLVDLSGSMGPRKMDARTARAYGQSKSWYAHRVVIALAETFDKLGIPCEVIGYHNNYDRMPDIDFRNGRPTRDGYQAREPFDFLVFKEHGESLKQCRERFAAINGYQDNCDGEAVRMVGKRLALRPEARKILFVVSDGMPAATGSDFTMLNNDLRDAVTELTRAGVDVFGIGVLSDAVNEFYNKATGSASIVIDDLDQMATQVYKVVRAKLLRGNRRAA